MPRFVQSSGQHFDGLLIGSDWSKNLLTVARLQGNEILYNDFLISTILIIHYLMCMSISFLPVL